MNFSVKGFVVLVLAMLESNHGGNVFKVPDMLINIVMSIKKEDTWNSDDLSKLPIFEPSLEDSKKD